MMLKNTTTVLRQNKQHEQIKSMADHGPLCKMIKMIKEIFSNQQYGMYNGAFLMSFGTVSFDCPLYFNL